MLRTFLTVFLAGTILPAAAADRSGEEIFNTTCVACHASGAQGIPQKGDKEAWAPRIAKGKEALYSSVLNGRNAMPPRGMCMGCSDDEIRAAADYMISQSR